MATSSQLISLYGDLRATLLSRHFAVGRYFRANYLSLFNHLGVLRAAGSTASGDVDDRHLGCDSSIVRPSIYTSAFDLLTKDATTQMAERWRVGNHERENPLMFSGQLLICLAVEHHIGRPVKSIIKEALRSIGSLYKFKQEHFRGYPIRWDAITSDRWATRNESGRIKPRYCCEFFLGSDRTSYLYCTPFQDPRYTPFVRKEDIERLTLEEKRAYHEARSRSLHLHRIWEPSMDELVGLIMGYDIIFRLVDDVEIRGEVRRQVNNLGDYLAEHGYLLVRPCGGFTARGASGVLPAFEFPWGRVFERITGNRYEPRVGFEGACDKAGVWKCLEGPMRTATTLAVVASIVLLPALAVLAGGLSGILIGILGTILGLTLGVVLARAYVIWNHRDCFDVWAWPGDGTEAWPERKDQQEEFVAAYLLKKLPTVFRFRFWFGLAEDRVTAWSGLFPAFIALTGLDDVEATVRKLYLKFLPERRKHPNLDEKYSENDKYARNPFASAVAVVLGAGETEEKKLVELLDRWYRVLTGHHKQDFRLSDETEGHTQETFRPALPFMAALALAWLHAKRRADAGSPIPGEIGFPTPPAISDRFPDPSVPLEVREARNRGEIVLPGDTWGPRGDDTGRDSSGNLFGSAGSPSKQEEPPPPDLKPSVEKQLVRDVTVTVTEADWEVDTGVDLQLEDEYVIEASGEIWAGVLATGTNGPNGWNNIDYDLKFPAHGPPNGHPYALIGKLGSGGYFFVGDRFPKNDPDREPHLGPGTQRLWLRTNDDVPNNGSKREPGKAFNCRIRVWR